MMKDSLELISKVMEDNKAYTNKDKATKDSKVILIKAKFILEHILLKISLTKVFKEPHNKDNKDKASKDQGQQQFPQQQGFQGQQQGQFQQQGQQQGQGGQGGQGQQGFFQETNLGLAVEVEECSLNLINIKQGQLVPEKHLFKPPCLVKGLCAQTDLDLSLSTRDKL